MIDFQKLHHHEPLLDINTIECDIISKRRFLYLNTILTYVML